MDVDVDVVDVDVMDVDVDVVDVNIEDVLDSEDVFCSGCPL